MTVADERAAGNQKLCHGTRRVYEHPHRNSDRANGVEEMDILDRQSIDMVMNDTPRCGPRSVGDKFEISS